MAYTFPPASAVRTKALFAQCVGVPVWDDLIGAFADVEKRAGSFCAFDTGITGLARLYAQKEGLLLEGQTPSYADLVVGGWLRNFSQFLEQEEWTEFYTWHGGVFGRLHEVLRRQYWEVR
jgi:glutathione S-transferase